MYQGRQFTEYNPTQQKMIEVPAGADELRIVINLIEPIVRTEMAKTGSRHPMSTVAPASNDYADIAAASAAEAAVQWFYRDCRYQTEVFNPANFWRTVTGNGFTKVFWDSSVEDRAATEAALTSWQGNQPAEAPPEGGLMGLFGPVVPAPTPKPGPVMGKIVAEPVSPFHLLVPNMAETRLQKQPYVIHAYTISLEQARVQFGDQFPADWSPATVLADSIQNVAHLGIQSGNTAQPDSVRILEAYVKPGTHKLFPKGGAVKVLDGRVVQATLEGMPYRHGDYPFQHMTGIESGRFYRKSVVTSVTPIQNDLNRTVAQLIKYRNLVAKPMFYYDEGSLDVRRIRTRPGTYIPIRIGHTRPTPVPIQEMPQYVSQLMQQMKTFLDDISGQHQVSRAISPGADTAASALSLLKETDDDFLSASFDSIEAASESIGRQVLSLMVEKWEEPRLVKVVGGGNAFDAKMLMGADIVTGTDLYVEAGSSRPESKAGRRAQITEWVDKGLVPPEVGLEAMEMGSLGAIYSRLKIDKSQAQRENIEMRDMELTPEVLAAMQPAPAPVAMGPVAVEDGVDPQMGMQPAAPASPFPINWYDNDAVHIAEHEAYAKTEEFQTLEPERQKIFELHHAAHVARAEELRQREAMMAAPDQPGAEGRISGYAGGNEQQAITA